MLYKAILYNSTNRVEVEEISDEKGKNYVNNSKISCRFAVGETETIALDKLFEGIKETAQKHFNAYQECIKMLDTVKGVINNKRKMN